MTKFVGRLPLRLTNLLISSPAVEFDAISLSLFFQAAFAAWRGGHGNIALGKHRPNNREKREGEDDLQHLISFSVLLDLPGKWTGIN